jgi:hypothetical protein
LGTSVDVKLASLQSRQRKPLFSRLLSKNKKKIRLYRAIFLLWFRKGLKIWSLTLREERR